MASSTFSLKDLARKMEAEQGNKSKEERQDGFRVLQTASRTCAAEFSIGACALFRWETFKIEDLAVSEKLKQSSRCGWPRPGESTTSYNTVSLLYVSYISASLSPVWVLTVPNDNLHHTLRQGNGQHRMRVAAHHRCRSVFWERTCEIEQPEIITEC